MNQSLSHTHVELNFLPKLLLGILCICLYTSCGDLFPSGKDDARVVDAEIIRIDIEPNPVQVGDTVTFTCVLEDSLADDLLFEWQIPDSQTKISIISTAINKYSFKVELEEGEYYGGVSVDDTLQDGIRPYRMIEFQVIEK